MAAASLFLNNIKRFCSDYIGNRISRVMESNSKRLICGAEEE